jgi:hypothetical protein
MAWLGKPNANKHVALPKCAGARLVTKRHRIGEEVDEKPPRQRLGADGMATRSARATAAPSPSATTTRVIGTRGEKTSSRVRSAPRKHVEPGCGVLENQSAREK